MVLLTTILLSALLICAVVQGASLSKSGVVHKSSVEPERDDHNILPSTYNTGRQLFPHPSHEHHDNHAHPHPPHPPSHHNNEDSKYTGCLGLSEDELASIWEGKEEDAPPCTISVNGIVVAGHDSSTTESGSSISSGSDTPGSESSGSSESNSSSGINTDSSTSGGVEEEDDRGINKVEDHEDDSDGSSGGYYSYEVDEGNGVGASDINGGSGIDGDDSNETNNSSGSDTSANGTSSKGTDDSINNGDEDDDVPSPLVYFNISDCGSYSNMWVWDLAMTCSDSSMNQTDCKCTSAEILMHYGELYCPSSEDPFCPDNCSVCHTCMELLGCSSPDDAQDGQYLPPEQVLLGDGKGSTVLPLALGIAAAILGLVGSSYYQYTHRYMDTGAFPSLELEPPSNASML